MAKGKKKEELTIEEKLEQALVPREEWPYEVPENWCWVRLGSISKIISKGTTPKGGREAYAPEGVNFLRIENINDDGYISHEHMVMVKEDVHLGVLKRSILHKNDILISIAGTLGKTAIVREVDLPMNTNQAVSFVRLSDDRINEKYIRYSIDNPIIQRLLLSKTKVTSIPNLTLEIISDCYVPFAPLAEQQRIVDRIESLFSKLDEAKEKAQEALDSFEERKAAILHKAFSGELTKKWREENGVSIDTWEKKKICDFADVKGGKRIPKGKSLINENTGHPYLKAGNLKKGTVIDDGIMFVPDDVLPQIKNYTVNEGDVYITNVGACIGDCGVIPPKYDGANLTENAVKITNLKKCINLYLSYYIASNNVQHEIKTKIASATLGKLSIANVKSITVSLPSINEQKEIIDKMESLLEKSDEACNYLNKVICYLEVIKKSILAKAFRGELGTNNMEEESLELLKTIL